MAQRRNASICSLISLLSGTRSFSTIATERSVDSARRLKASEETRRIPIIALTADAMLGDRDKAYAAGCDDFDTKPVDLVRLLKKLETLLAARPGA